MIAVLIVCQGMAHGYSRSSALQFVIVYHIHRHFLASDMDVMQCYRPAHLVEVVTGGYQQNSIYLVFVSVNAFGVGQDGVLI